MMSRDLGGGGGGGGLGRTDETLRFPENTGDLAYGSRCGAPRSGNPLASVDLVQLQVVNSQ